VQQPAARALTDERSRWRTAFTLDPKGWEGILSGFTHYPHHLILNSVTAEITKSRCASAQDRAREVRAPSHPRGNFTDFAQNVSREGATKNPVYRYHSRPSPPRHVYR